MKSDRVRVSLLGSLHSKQLCLLALAVIISSGCHAQADPVPSRVYNVVDFGAKNDASQLATHSFQRAIHATKGAGGGTIYVPAGKYISGPIELFSNMTLDVSAGATIEFPVVPLPLVKSRYLGVEALVPQPLISATDVENVTVTGRGVLTTGDYGAWGKAYGAEAAPDASGNANGPHWQHVLESLEAKQPVTDEEYRAAGKELRPSFIGFTRAKNVLVEDVRIVGAPMFVVHLLYSENATVRNVMVQAFPGPHANGIVVDSSRFVRISGDYIDTGDDGIVIKAGKDADGLRVHKPSEDVAITNCTVHHAHGAVVIGSETSGDIRNVVASNITAFDTENGIRIKSRRGRGGIVEDVRFDNWTMEHVGTGIVVDSYYLMGGETVTREELVSERTPVFRNIGISNVTITSARKAVAQIEGLPEMPIASLWISNVIGQGAHGLSAQHTDDLELRNIQVNAESGPAFAIDSASNLEMMGIGSRHPAAGQPVLRLSHAPQAILRDSRVFPGTEAFLEADPEQMRTMHLEEDQIGVEKTTGEKH